jgi:GNAT superfamily N-acetyltransferase
MNEGTMADIRRAKLSDVAAVVDSVAALLAELAEGDEPADRRALEALAREFLQRDGNAALIAVHRSEAVGVITLEAGFAVYAGGAIGTIRELYVRPASRSQRVGSQLIASALEHARASGWHRLEVTAPELPRWSRTRSFYLREGFLDAGPKLKRLVSQ